MEVGEVFENDWEGDDEDERDDEADSRGELSVNIVKEDVNEWTTHNAQKIVDRGLW